MTKEKIVRKVIEIVFIVRYWVILILMGGLGYLTYYVAHLKESQIRDTVSVFTGGCVVISVFYAFINYEYAQRKFKHDVKTGRDIASFNIAMEWQKEYMTDKANELGRFYRAHKQLLEDGMPRKFQDELDKDENEKAYVALIAVINFLESVSLAVNQGIMDEDFIKGFFGSLFVQEYNRYIGYIEFRRRQKQNPKIWKSFTDLSQKWISCA